MEDTKDAAYAARRREKNREKVENMPIIESAVYRSKDGKWIIHKTTITDIRAAKYYEKVLAGDAEDAAKPSEDIY